MDWFSLCLRIFGVTAQGILHVLFLFRLTGRRVRGWQCAAHLLLLFGIEGLCSAAGWGTLPALAAELLAVYGLGRLALNCRNVPCWTAAVLAVYGYQLSDGVVNSLEALMIPRLTVGSAAVYVVVILAAAAAPALCSVLCLGLVPRFLSLREDGLHLKLLLLPGVFFFAAELYVLETAYSRVPTASEGPWKHLALLSLQLLGLAALFCSLYAYRRACRGIRAQAALDSLAQSVRAQRTYVAEAQARYEKTKAFRHDLQNHLSVLSGLLRAGRTEEARDYLRKLEAVSSALAPPCRTGNPAVDALLAEKLALARDQGVDTDVTVRLPEGPDGFDLCVIFANALDNALAACGAVGEKAFLRIRDQRQGELYCLTFENSCRPGSAAEPGVGLSNIRAVSEKYRGAMEVRQAGGRFRLDVLLNISEQPDGSSEQKPCGPS